MRNVDDGADAIGSRKFDALPERVQEALGELAGVAKEGLLALWPRSRRSTSTATRSTPNGTTPSNQNLN